MGFYRQKVLPHLLEWTMDRDPFRELRRRALGELDGRVLEIGFGTGLNLPFYPSGVTELLALDAMEFDKKYLESRRSSACPPLRFIHSPGERIPLEDRSVDYVVTTWTLCSVDDPDKVLSEAKRVLKPGGRYVFVEHGKSPEPFVSKLQDWLTPVQQRIGGGCRLNRKMDEIVARSGLDPEQLDRFYMKGPKIGAYIYLGHARKSAA